MIQSSKKLNVRFWLIILLLILLFALSFVWFQIDRFKLGGSQVFQRKSIDDIDVINRLVERLWILLIILELMLCFVVYLILKKSIKLYKTIAAIGFGLALLLLIFTTLIFIVGSFFSGAYM